VMFILCLRQYSVCQSQCFLNAMDYIKGYSDTLAIMDTLLVIEELIEQAKKPSSMTMCNYLDTRRKENDCIDVTCGMRSLRFCILLFIQQELFNKTNRNDYRAVYIKDQLRPWKICESLITSNLSQKYSKCLKISQSPMKRIIKKYSRWCKKSQRYGLDYLRKNNIDPLSGSRYSWCIY